MILLYGNVNRVARFTRIGKLYKIIRMAKMIRLLKIAKVRNKLVKDLSDILRISVGVERLLFLLIIFLLLVHIIACFWVFIAKFDENSKDNWIYNKDYVDYEDYELYVTSFYFSVTTIVTVGYGDITAISVGEKIVAVILMITGVIAFSFATGALSSIISSYDSTEAKLKEKLATLNDISAEYRLDDDLYNRLVKNIRYDHSRKQKDVL
jgi:Ion channel